MQGSEQQFPILREHRSSRFSSSRLSFGTDIFSLVSIFPSSTCRVTQCFPFRYRNKKKQKTHTQAETRRTKNILPLPLKVNLKVSCSANWLREHFAGHGGPRVSRRCSLVDLKVDLRRCHLGHCGGTVSLEPDHRHGHAHHLPIRGLDSLYLVQGLNGKQRPESDTIVHAILSHAVVIWYQILRK